MKKFLRLLTVTLAVLTFALCAVSATAGTGVSAYNGVALDDLANQDLLKLNGRVRIDDGYLSGDYSGTGFSTNIIADVDTELEIFVDTNYSNKVSIWVDGACVDTEMVYGDSSDHGKMIACGITAGAHEIMVVKESQLSSATTAYFRFTNIRFEGTVESKVADKDLLIEVIGDSISCGDGADASYETGEAWMSIQDDAITKSFGWYLSEMLDADFREVGRGGQGLDGTAAQEEQTNTVTMPILYDYLNYADQNSGTKWTETRTPDLVIIELGANDSCSASNKATWVSIAKNFLIKIEEKYNSSVPIIWNCNNNQTYFYQGLREALETDEELSAYGNIYLMYNYYHGNGSAALASQTSGHPDAEDQYDCAERIYDYIQSEGVLGVEETVSNHQYVFYISEDGSNDNDGLTAANAKLTVYSTITAAKAYLATLSEIPADAEVVFKVTGEVRLTTAQNLTLGIEIADLKTRADGTILPLVFETYNYDGTSRAVLRSDFQPVNAGNASTYSLAPVIFRNVTLRFIEGDASGTAGTKYTVSKICGQYGDITFDNTTITTDSGATVNVYANNFSYNKDYHEGILNGTEERHHTITFLNGTYDATTGFGQIAALGGVNSLWVSSSLSYYAVPGLTAEIVVGYGAVMDGTNLFINSSTLSCKEAILTVKTGGQVIGNFKGTTSGTSSSKKSVKANLTLNIEGGHFKGAFAMLGNYVTMTGDTKFVMTGGEIYVPGTGTSEETNSIVLGGGFNTDTVTGNEYKEIHGGLLYVIGVSNVQSGIHMSGRASQTVSGVSENLMTGGVILLVPTGTKANASSVYFGLSSGTIKTELRNLIYGGLINQSQYSNTIFFGGQATSAVIKKLTNVIGVASSDGRSVGPKMYASYISLASGWGQYGRTSRNAAAVSDAAAITSDTVVISTTIYGGDFDGTVQVAQTGSSTSTYYPRTEGSLECTVYGGRFTSAFNFVNASALYGHATLNLEGGYFKEINGVLQTALITNGLSITIGDIQSYGQVQTSSSNSTPIGPFNFNPLVKGSVQTLLSDGDAFTLTINGGQGMMNLNLSDSASVLASGETYSVTVNGGKFQSVSGTLATGAVKGGWYAETPDETLLASGYEVKTFSQSVDQLYTCYVDATSASSDHQHCVCGGAAVGVGTHTTCDETVVWTPVSSYNDLKAAVTTGASLDGYYYLTNDIQLKASISLLQNQKLHICLNGHTINAYNGSRCFSVYNSEVSEMNAQLDITDCQVECGTIQGGYHKANGANILIFCKSTLNIYNGRIYGGQAAGQTTSKTSYGSGGNINIDSNCTFNMFGGVVEGGQSRRYGGNITNCGTANIYAGEIINGRVAAALSDANAWIVGGNIYNKGTLNIYDGLISGGKANYGGNIYTNKTLNLFGGMVKSGEALTTNGGNILADKTSTTTISGGYVMDGVANARWNTSADDKKIYIGCGGNIYMQGTLTMTGGEIIFGDANYSGGNIFFNKDNLDAVGTISGGRICNGSARFGGNFTIEGTDTETKKVIVSGTAQVLAGTALYNTTGGDGHGGNVYLSTGGELTVAGGEISEGRAGKTCGGGNISATGTNSKLTISGGKIQNAYAYASGETDAEVASIVMFGNRAQTFTMTGGYIGVQNENQVVLRLSSTTSTTASISGGFIQGVIGGGVGGYLEGGYYTEYPASKYLADDYQAFKLSTAVENDGVSYDFEVAKGFLAVTQVAVKEGSTRPIANLVGGGQFRAGNTTTLSAPAEVGPYRFIQWQTEDGTQLTEETTYEVKDASDGYLFYALYEFAKSGLTLNVNGTNFKVSTKAPTESEFTDKTYTEDAELNLAYGTQVVVTYLGEDDFAAWTNNTNKYISSEKEYAFTLYIDEELNEFVTKKEAAASKVTIVYMNAYKQVLKTVDASDVATEIPEIPAQIGMTATGWSKSVSELQAEIAEVASGEAKTIIVTPVYVDDETLGSVSVYKAIATNVGENFADEMAVSDELPTEYRGPISKVLDITAKDEDGYEFCGYADEDGIMLTLTKVLSIRPTVEGVTVYAVYSENAGTQAPKATITYAGVVTEGTAQVDVTRALPEGFTVVEQGFLLSTSARGCDTTEAKEMLVLETTTGVVRKISKLDGATGVAALRMSGLTDTAEVFARGYIIYRNETSGEIGVVYTDVVLMKKSSTEIF